MPTREQLGQLARMRRQETFVGRRARQRGGGARLGSGLALTLRRKAERALRTRPPIRQATIAGPRGLAIRVAATGVRKILGRPRAQQVQAIFRQQVARVTPPVKVAAVVGGAVGAERAIEAVTGRSPARMIFDLTKGGGERLIRPTGQGTPSRRQQMPGTQLAVQHVAIRQWQTFPGGPVFTRFADGHIEVQKKDGTIKHFRPYRPVVIPRKWNARSMSRVATALKRQRKTATKILQLTGGVPKRTVRVSSQPHKSVDV